MASSTQVHSPAGPAANGQRPDPTQINTPAQLLASLRLLKNLSGLSYRQLERNASRNGDVLPRSTVVGALARDNLPRPALVAAFVRACGVPDRDADHWLSAHQRLVRQAAAAELAELAPDRGPAAQLLPPIWYRFGWRVRLLAGMVALLGVVAVLLVIVLR